MTRHYNPFIPNIYIYLFSIIFVFFYLSPSAPLVVDAVQDLNNVPKIIVPELARLRVINTIVDLSSNGNGNGNGNNNIRGEGSGNRDNQEYYFDVVFNYSSLTIPQLAYLSMSDYVTLPAGPLQIRVVGSDTVLQPIADSRDIVNLERDTDYTLILSGVRNNATIIRILPDVGEPISGNRRTSMRFVHCAPTAPSVDFGIVNGATLFADVSFIGGSGGNAGANYISIPSNPYIFNVHEPQNTSNIYIANIGPLPTNAPIYSMLMVGIPNDIHQPLRLLPVPYVPSGEAATAYMKQLPYTQVTQVNTQLPPYSANPSTSASSSTLVKFSIAILSFLVLGAMSFI
eukprot:gene16662-19801_t